MDACGREASPVSSTLSRKVLSMIRGRFYRRAVVAALFATMLAVPHRPVIGAQAKRGDKSLKTIELSGDYIIPIVVKVILRLLDDPQNRRSLKP